ncbi:DNA-binding domain-containing protein [Ferrimonas lipolytica]|uniref:DUF2063 domain-containing protein n=1 Tax=Ferrimonas lipolytica TaxID=2724191 RepID=A0A6H1UDL2_9GAMM|nr:putative DNA-binding domain-containing protein [Ferrimonas lipolytica]QIZ75892.1 DUF2063 domain-containing protein [Ferrimonas lipolytica]
MSDFSQIQQQFMDHIRAPEPGSPPLQLEARRMDIYRELMFNNVCGFINSGYPVLKSITDELVWQQRLRTFFAEYDCHSPLFVDISAAFLHFLQQQPDLLLWEVELAHYEQLELKIDILAEVTDQTAITEAEQLLSASLCLYRAAEIGKYGYPVHQIGVDNPQVEAQPTYLLVYRNAEDDVAFMELNPMTAQLVGYVQQHPGCSAQQVAEAMITAMPELEPEVVAQGAGQLMLQMAGQGIIRQQ